jgi:hypothetical protein
MAETTSDTAQQKLPQPVPGPAPQPVIEAPATQSDSAASAPNLSPGLGSPDGFAPPLNDARLAQSANRPRRVQALTAMQRQLGNQAVQRFVARGLNPGAFAPVQRDTAGLARVVPGASSSGAKPAAPQDALQAALANIVISSDTAAALERIRAVWTTDGQSGAQIYVNHLLKRLWIESGPRLLDQVVDGIVTRIRADFGARMFDNDPAVNRDLLIANMLTAEQKRLHADAEEFVVYYEARAIETAKGALIESEDRVTGELKRYLGSNWITDFVVSSDDEPHSEKEDEASKRGLGIAAAGLAKRRNALIQANAAYRAALGNHSLPWADRKPIEDARVAAEEDFDLFRKQVIPRFPILEEFSAPNMDPVMDQDVEPDDAQGQQLSQLAQLAQDAGNEDANHLILDQVFDKLKNIAKVRAELKPGGEVSIWHVPKIVDATSELTGATPGTLYGKVVEDKQNEQPPRSLTGRLIDILEISLLVLAPFTEGLTLIPAAAIATARAGNRVYQHWKEYEAQKALHGTDFGAAALSADDPSLFWLAADVAGAFVEVGLSVVPAVEVFRALRTAARAARVAQAGEEAIVTLQSAAKTDRQAARRRKGRSFCRARGGRCPQGAKRRHVGHDGRGIADAGGGRHAGSPGRRQAHRGWADRPPQCDQRLHQRAAPPGRGQPARRSGPHPRRGGRKQTG